MLKNKKNELLNLKYNIISVPNNVFQYLLKKLISILFLSLKNTPFLIKKKG